MVKQMINEKLKVYVKCFLQNVCILSFKYLYKPFSVLTLSSSRKHDKQCWNRTDESILDIL